MRVFSGIQPTGEIHIGNYLGALQQWVQLQEKNECVFCIVDLHALTVPYETKGLQQRIKEKAIAYLAAGVNPKQSIIFVQSQVKEHVELNWLLSTITPIGDLQRMTQFKDKSKKYSQNINAGLFNYPVLMAADILLYDTDLVPVGQDQKQHVELAREIARRFNNKFGRTFKLPEAMLAKAGAKIMSLATPTKKMSKSDAPQSYISLFDKPEDIQKKISAATTDSGKEVKYSPKQKPGISNLLTIYSLFSNRPVSEIEKEFRDKGYAQFKQKLAQLLIEKLEPFRQKKKDLENKTGLLEKILEDGAKRSRVITNKKMELIKKQMGLS